MPIDPAIPLSAVARPVEPFNPLITLSQLAQLANQREALALRQQEAAEIGQTRELQRLEIQGRLEERQRTFAGQDALAEGLQTIPRLDPETGEVRPTYDQEVADFVIGKGHPAQAA